MNKDLKTLKKCPKCGKPLEVREGSYGTYLDCTGYPKCKYTFDISGASKNKLNIPSTCPKCGKKLAIYNGKFGAFLGCNGYPNCNYTYNFEDTSNISCPICGRIMKERTGKHGLFYGCSGFPECRFTFPMRVSKKKTPRKRLEIPQEYGSTSNKILNVLSNEWQNLSGLTNILGCNDEMDVKYILLKLKEFERKGLIVKDFFDNEEFWKKN